MLETKSGNVKLPLPLVEGDSLCPSLEERAHKNRKKHLLAEGARCSGEDAGFLIHSPGFESPLVQVPTSCESWTKSTGGSAAPVIQMATGKWYYRGKRHCSAQSLKRPVRCSPIPRRTIPRGWTDAGLLGEAAALVDCHMRRGWSFHQNHQGN